MRTLCVERNLDVSAARRPGLAVTYGGTRARDCQLNPLSRETLPAGRAGSQASVLAFSAARAKAGFPLRVCRPVMPRAAGSHCPSLAATRR